MSIRQIPHPPGEKRIETGATQFGKDWPGLFIRGDGLVELKLLLMECLNHDIGTIKKLQAKYYIDTIKEVLNEVQ